MVNNKEDCIIKYNLQKYQQVKISKLSLGVLGVISCVHLSLTNDIECTGVINALVLLMIFRNLNKSCLHKTKPNHLQLGCTYVVLMLITTFLSYAMIETKEMLGYYPVPVALGVTITLLIYNKVLPKVLLFYYAIKVVLACCEECED